MKKIAIIITIVFMVLCAVVVYFGRIYYPYNFHPEEVTFFENYWVLALGFLITVGVFTISMRVYGSLVKN